MADIVLSVASKVAEYVVAPVVRHCDYVIFPNSNVRQLEEELEKLENARQRVQHSIDEARNDMKPIEADVEKWVTDMETVTDKARNLLERDGRAKKTCFYGWLPNPKERYRLGRDTRRTVLDIQALISKSQFHKVYHESAPPGHVASASDVSTSAGDRGDTIIESRASILEKIMDALDDEKFKVIGVYGPGGVGKTTLLVEVEKKLRSKKRLFDMIAKAKVSQTQDPKKIQDDIAYAFSLNLKDEPSEEGRRDRLFRKIQSDPMKKVLIILDDLWDKLDLKVVGIPSGEESRGCKLLLTSRFKDVLEQKMHADRIFHLEGLNNDEAFRLFEKTVGDRLKDEELKPIAAQVVEKLAGLPLLITSVASTLKYSGVSTWKNALIKIDDSNIETIVKLSYDHLKSENAKSLFLLCGLIGGTIEVELLLGLGMGLGLFEGFNNTIEDSRDRLNTMLDSLCSSCLLQDGGDDKENVTIHDLYSEVVVSTPFKGQNSLMMNSNYGSWPKEKLEKCWAICLVNVVGLARLKQYGFPDLKILMLSQPGNWLGPVHQHYEGDCCKLDFTYMKELRVLYLFSMHITNLSPSIEILGNLQSLYLDHCLVNDVAILGKLKALQILSFAGSEICRLPKEIGELTNLRLLNLNYCEVPKIDSGVLKSLINLEELHMKGSFDQWLGEDEIPSESCNARLAELKSLTKLTTLEISIRDPAILFKDGDLPFGNLIRFWITIGNVDGRKFQGLRTMKLKLEGCDSILSKEWVQKTLQKTQYLHLDGLGGFKKNTHEFCIQGFKQLKHLDIQNSPSIKYIASSSNDPLTAFTILESLFLENLFNLEKICNGPVAPDCFSKLKAVRIEKCHRLKNLWFLSEMQRLVHLEEIQIRECDSLQAIITDDAGKVEVVADDIVELPNVRRLDLHKLPNMMSFCTGAEGAPIQVSLPRLESLVMVGLIGLEEILFSEPSLKYSNLKSLQIEESKSTSKSILKLDWILKLPNLESLDILFCRSAEVVFDLAELKVTGDVEILSQLTKLKLRRLLNLQRKWKQDAQLQGIPRFRNLKELFVGDTGLAFLFPVSVAKCLREIRDIEVVDCPNMKAVIVDEERRDEGTNDIIEFPLLKRLSIVRCPMEKFFSYPHRKKESVTTTSDSQDAYSDFFFDPKVSLPSLEKLELKSVGSFKGIWHSELMRSSFCKLATLSVGYCSKLLNVFPSTIIGRLHNLTIVKIESCPSLESLFDCGSPDANTEQTTLLLSELEELTVKEAGKLSCMVTSECQTVLGFPNLKIVHVYSCSDLRYLFPNFTATTLEKLENLLISNCEQMKEVVPKEIAKGDDESPQPLFNEMVIFPNIRNLKIEGAQCKELWNNQIPDDSFCKLEFLRLVHCDNLQCIAPSHMWKRLQLCLDLLEVRSCRLIETIYESDGTNTENGQLRKLVLHDLENLRHIWQSDGLPIVPFPNLRYVEAVMCSRLEMLFTTFTAKFLGQIKELVVESCEDLKLIAGHEECEEATGTTITFSKLTALRLFELPKFRNILAEKYSEEFPSLEVCSLVSCGTTSDHVFGDWESYKTHRILKDAEMWKYVFDDGRFPSISISR
ncbi:disease resistance protein At4g27190-like isoform X1 [Syzygium oleosum]|uniref:disease resistance protein At4g27190-like isoform X1 n=1 Tax=Syzygium oleosum TaxID=219896 RepID=UPI0011D2462C|nr:disease resistance protein At4g27190-like isoform X1 [Syzygium oleosum]